MRDRGGDYEYSQHSADEDEDEDEEEEEDEDDEYDGSEEDEVEKNEPKEKGVSVSDEDLPLFMRLQQSSVGDTAIAEAGRQRRLKKAKKNAGDNESGERVIKEKKKKSKNAPAEMPSNKPVRRLRIDADVPEKKYRDPRFDELSGKLNMDKFYQSNQFLDEYQEDEIEKLAKKLKKTKNEETKAILKEELVRAKQQMTERRRSQKVAEKLRSVRQEELEKVKKGKTPFYLKASAKKKIALETRYEELKKSGKLQSFLNKKRKRNASKDHRKIPKMRED